MVDSLEGRRIEASSFDRNIPYNNKMDAASSKVGGGLGIFFMAVTLAIVSFSCTGPILGGLLGSTTLAVGDVRPTFTD